MIIKNAELVAVTGISSLYPADNMPEIAFAGRSNVGKSSLINLLLNRRNFARVSGNPGKTRTINFYEINGSFRIVDLPGYGYSKVSKSISADWGDMIEAYLESRKNLIQVIQLVDSRHEPSVQDIQMYNWLRHYNLNGVVIATKSDKISKNELFKNKNIIRTALGMDRKDQIIAVSTLKKAGYDEVLKTLEELLVKPKEELVTL